MKKNLLKICSLCLCAILLFCIPVFSSAAEEPLNYVALGDSIAAGTRLKNADVQCYGAIIAKTIGWNFTNCAVPGHTTFSLEKRLKKQEVQQAVKQADIITVSIGGNNFLLNDMSQMVSDGLLHGDYSRMDDIIAEFKENFDVCIQKIKKLNPDAKLFVQTLYNPMPGLVAKVSAQGQQRLNAAYKAYLDTDPDAYTLVDIAPLFEGHSDYIATDFIHPNAKGHLVIAQAYIKTFHEMGLCDADTIVKPTFKDIYNLNLVKILKDWFFQFTNALEMMFGGKEK